MALISGPMFFSKNLHAPTIKVVDPSDKTDMHSNSHDIQQRVIDGVPQKHGYRTTSNLIRDKVHKYIFNTTIVFKAILSHELYIAKVNDGILKVALKQFTLEWRRNTMY